ncbi:Sporulation stage III, protein AE [Syntrophomonas zehnderi OL-4]|uniref:Sporulation stage III, protein AE n=1 Tax=Syntrophomonas zehnderi OL-4 TaxID=690567 RepID=A0A0E3W347_9FIRM|nr:Sporulation stage III, protein AE [Syntrophomonas zehnderi OL-4]
MRKTGWIGLFILVLILLLPLPAVAVENAANAEVFSFQDSMQNIDMSDLEKYKANIDGELNSYLQHKSVKEWLLDFSKGDWQLNPQEILSNIVKFFGKEFLANSGLLSKLIILSVLAALLINLQQSFTSEVGKIAYMACFLALCAIAIGSFKVVLGIGQHTIDNMVTFMLSMLPQMMVLVTGLGNVNASVMLFPLLMTTATAFASAIKTIVFPLIIISATLHLVNGMSDTIKVERLAKFFGQVSQLVLGFLLTFFVGIITLRALYASVLDKVTLRTTRFVTDNAVPVIGKMLGDTVEVAAGYVVMLKQALGIFGVLIVFGIIIFPLVEIAVLALIYKLVGAVVEPIGDPRTAAVLEIMSTHLFLMLAATAAVGLMFFIMIAIVAGLYNSAFILR